MYDSYGDGWNGNDFTLVSSNGITFFTSTLSSGSSGVDSVCVPDDCYSVSCGGGSWQYEVSWTLTDSSGIVLLSGGAPYSGNICFPNYPGCTNPLADNYDSTANLDDGSCIYSNCNPLVLNMYDSYGDGWNGNDFTLVSSNGITFFTSTLSSGSSGVDSVCVPDDCYSVSCGGGSWQYEVSWTLTDSSGIVLLSGGAPYIDSLCFPNYPGCTNPLADNYDSTANIDDGSCLYLNCNPLVLNMYDSYGDGWNGNDFTLVSSNGITFFTSTLSSGSSGVDSVCVPDDCYSVSCGGGSWQYEVSWTLTDSSGIVLLSGGAPYSDLLCFPISYGCTNSFALNYDSIANTDDGSCLFACLDIDTTESFESGQGYMWMLDPNNTVDWTNQSGATGSIGTGPSGAFDGSYYMYTEASGSGINSEAIMYVPCIDPTQWSQLSLVFAHHMYGTAMGTLSIDVSVDSGATWIEQWTLSGNQANQWNESFVDLSSFSTPISVRVQAETGTSYTSDIAIDLLRFMELPMVGCTDPFAR